MCEVMCAVHETGDRDRQLSVIKSETSIQRSISTTDDGFIFTTGEIIGTGEFGAGG